MSMPCAVASCSVWRAGYSLVICASLTERTAAPSEFRGDGTPIDFGTLHDSSGRTLTNPAGVLGSPLAGSPPFQGNVCIRYQFDFLGYEAFAQLSAVHLSHSLATLERLSLDAQGQSTFYDLPPVTTRSASLGAGRDAWQLQLCADNLTDTRAELFANYGGTTKPSRSIVPAPSGCG